MSVTRTRARRLAGVCLTLAVVTVALPGTAAGAADDHENATVTAVTVWTGPADLDDELDDRRAVERAIADRRVSDVLTVEPDGTVLLTLAMEGVDRRFAATTGPNETARFFETLAAADGSVSLVQLNPSPERPAKVARLDQPAATTVIADERNDTYYLVVDVEALAAERPPSDGDGGPTTDGDASLERGDVMGLNVTVDGQTRFFDGPAGRGLLFVGDRPEWVSDSDADDTETPTVTTASTVTPTATTATDTPTPSAEESPARTSSPATGPGFGTTVAVLALVLAALFGSRRRT